MTFFIFFSVMNFVQINNVVKAYTVQNLLTNGFSVSGNKILDPLGNEFVAKGVGVNGANWVWSRETTQGGGWEINKKDGTRPTNLS